MTNEVRAELISRIRGIWDEVGMDVMRTMQDLGEEYDEESLADGVVDMAFDHFRPSYRKNATWAQVWIEDLSRREKMELVGQALFAWRR